VIKRAAILSTGDELTTGRIVDTNANWIEDKLFELGIEVVAVLTVGDHPDKLAWAWTQALGQADVVISTGGIGPTADDVAQLERVAPRPLESLRVVADGEHRDEVDADLEQLVGDPAGIGVDDASGGELVPGREDDGFRDHSHLSTSRAPRPA